MPSSHQPDVSRSAGSTSPSDSAIVCQNSCIEGARVRMTLCPPYALSQTK